MLSSSTASSSCPQRQAYLGIPTLITTPASSRSQLLRLYFPEKSPSPEKPSRFSRIGTQVSLEFTGFRLPYKASLKLGASKSFTKSHKGIPLDSCGNLFFRPMIGLQFIFCCNRPFRLGTRNSSLHPVTLYLKSISGNKHHQVQFGGVSTPHYPCNNRRIPLRIAHLCSASSAGFASRSQLIALCAK